MKNIGEDFQVLTFATEGALRDWLSINHATSHGIWIRIYRRGSGMPSVTFGEVLDEGLCFGWSESKRMSGDEESYLQCFTPRRAKRTTSKRNSERVKRLIKERKMKPYGLEALGMGKQ